MVTLLGGYRTLVIKGREMRQTPNPIERPSVDEHFIGYCASENNHQPDVAVVRERHHAGSAFDVRRLKMAVITQSLALFVIFLLEQEHTLLCIVNKKHLYPFDLVKMKTNICHPRIFKDYLSKLYVVLGRGQANTFSYQQRLSLQSVRARNLALSAGTGVRRLSSRFFRAFRV
jgi:hypothetical protein